MNDLKAGNRTFMKRRVCVPVLFAMLTASCANPVYLGRLPWAEGWREGRVTAVGEGQRFARLVESRCEGPLPKSGQPPRYVSMTFERLSRPRIWTVEIHQDLAVQVGQIAYANIRTCAFEPTTQASPHA